MIRRRHEFALIMLFVAVVVAVVAVISTGLVGLGQEQQQESVLKFTKSDLIYLLVLADKENESIAPGAYWPRFYAKFIIGRYL